MQFERWAGLCGVIVALGGCSEEARRADPMTETVAIGGTVIGLAGAGLVLRQGTDELPIVESGPFTFPGAIAVGSRYDVTVAAQPSAPTQHCTVTNGSGVAGAEPVQLTVTCTTLFTVGGTVSGLAGSGLAIANHGQDELAIANDGTFAFATPVASGTSFAVTVVAQPRSPTQTCTVAGGTGTVGNGDVTTVVVECAVDRFTIGGIATGLEGAAVLQNNGGDDITVTANGAFAFPTSVASSAPYAVTVRTQPGVPSQTCVVTNGAGTVTNADVADVRLDCTTNAFAIGGTVAGLAGDGLVLQNNGTDSLPVMTNGSFAFGTPVPSGQPYAVSVQAQPTNPAQVCLVERAAGTMGGAAIADVTVTCGPPTHTLGVVVNGLASSGLILRNNGGDDVAIAGNGHYGFSTPIAAGATYAVTVATQPSGQFCRVTDGDGSVGGSVPPAVEVTCVATLSAGHQHTCEVRGDGTLWCWGDNVHGQLGLGDKRSRIVATRVGSDANWATVVGGAYHTCGTRTDGTLWCWGADTYGQLGLGSGGAIEETTPKQVGAATTWATIAAARHTCATRTDGTLWCWGSNLDGVLGLGDFAARSTPVQVGTATTWTNVAAGFRRTCAKRSDGTLWCWGGGTTVPARVGTETTWAWPTVGDEYGCATRTDGSLWCWGDNADGQRGAGYVGGTSDVVRVGTEASWTTVHAGTAVGPHDGSATCARKTDGSLWCAGDNSVGRLGTGDTLPRLSFTPVAANVSWTSATLGSMHTCARAANAAVYCWGYNVDGRLGLGTIGQTATPAQVGSDVDWVQVATHQRHTCAIRQNGSLWCWGENPTGQLGVGTTSAYAAPVRVGSETTWTGVATGAAHTCATRSDGTLWCWGGEGQASSPTQLPGSGWRAVSAGNFHTCATRTDGSLWCWGANSAGKLGVGDTMDRDVPTRVGSANTWATVAADENHTCGVDVDGGLWCWGYNAAGQLGLGDFVNRSSPARVPGAGTWAAADPGVGFTCGLQVDGTLACWGYNGDGRLGLGDTTFRPAPTPLTSAVPWAGVSARSLHSCAIKVDGTLWCWGTNEYGQLGHGDFASQIAPVQVSAGWSAVSCGASHTCAIRTDGSLWCWGANGNGEAWKASPTPL